MANNIGQYMSFCSVKCLVEDTVLLWGKMDYISITVCVLVGLTIIWTFLKHPKRKGKVIPGPKGLPLAGHAFRVSIESLHFDMAEHVDKYGEIMAIDIFGRKLILLNSERMVRKAFLEEGKDYLNNRPPMFIQQQFFPDGSIALYQKGLSIEHNIMRKAFTKGFHVYGDDIEVFEATVKAEITNLLDKIETFEEKEFDFPEIIRHSITSLISVLLCGTRLSDEDELRTSMRDFIQAFSSSTNAAYDAVLTLFPFVRYIPGKYKTIYDQFKNNREILAEAFFYKYKMNGNDRGIIGYLLEEQQQEMSKGGTLVLTDACIIGIAVDIIVGGTLTTLGSITSTIICLMRHPDVCTRMQAEIFEVIGKDRLPKLADKSRCPYTEAVFMEVQRYITIVPLAGPHFCRENITLDGYDIPSNSVVLPNVWHIHHDEDVWGDPWVFRPERFLDENGQLLPHPLRKSLMIFGMGRRQCVGEAFARSRIFLYVTSLLQKWTFIPSDDKCGSCDPRSDQFKVNLTTLPEPFYCRVEENMSFDM